MAYKYSKGAFTASGSITAEEGLSSLTTLSASSTLQIGGASTLQGVTATTVSGTTSQFTILSASALGGAAVSGLTSLKLPSWDAGTGRFEDSYISRDGFGKTTISGALGLDVTGNVAVTSGFVSASNGLSAGGESTLNNVTINGNLTVLGTTISASVQNLIIEDKQIVLADGAANATAAEGAGFFVSGANVQLKYKQQGDGAASTSGDIFQFSGSTGYTSVQAKTFYGDLVGTMVSTVNTIGNADATLVTGVNYGNTNFTQTRTWNLPATPTTGSSVKIKGPSNLTPSGTVGGYHLVVSAPAPYSIDGDPVIYLESPYAAIECVFVSGTSWAVF